MCVCVTLGGSAVAWCGRYASPAVGASVCMPTFSAQTQQTLTQIAEGEVRNSTCSEIAWYVRGCVCARARVCFTVCVRARVWLPVPAGADVDDQHQWQLLLRCGEPGATGRGTSVDGRIARGTHGVAWDRACSTSRYAHLGFFSCCNALHAARPQRTVQVVSGTWLTANATGGPVSVPMRLETYGAHTRTGTASRSALGRTLGAWGHHRSAGR